MGKKKTGSKKGVKKKYRIEMTSLSLFLWGFCLLFLLTWVFVLGILVGRGFLPGDFTVISDLKSQIAKLEEITARKGPGQEGRRPKSREKDLELMFYEKLSNKKEEAKKREVVVRREDSTPKGREPRKSSVSKSATIPSVSGSKYTVQVASLGELDRAKMLISQLKQKGYSAYYYEVTINGKTYYRVRCGKFDSKRQATEFARKLERDSGIRGFVSKVE
ncbi:MAG: SPOR domain-containing protein [Deltaproteobacteria bacterium]|nr:SPOR domain-containing protein [Deltaproteobacteria bacterium]